MSCETFDASKSAFLLFIAESVHCLDLLGREMHIKFKCMSLSGLMIGIFIQIDAGWNPG